MESVRPGREVEVDHLVEKDRVGGDRGSRGWRGEASFVQGERLAAGTPKGKHYLVSEQVLLELRDRLIRRAGHRARESQEEMGLFSLGHVKNIHLVAPQGPGLRQFKVKLGTNKRVVRSRNPEPTKAGGAHAEVCDLAGALSFLVAEKLQRLDGQRDSQTDGREHHNSRIKTHSVLVLNAEMTLSGCLTHSVCGMAGWMRAWKRAGGPA